MAKLAALAQQGLARQFEQQRAAAAHKPGQTVLTAPIDGTVQQLTIHTVGGVVTPAERLRQRAATSRIALDRASLDVDGHKRKLEPGMEAPAEIRTGRRRVISYLLSPLQRYAHEGMRER